MKIIIADMNGKEVYKFATREVPEVLFECLEAAGMTVEQVDWLLLHQANIRIMETVAKRLGMPMEKVITNLNEYGNTSAASIPLALDEAVRSGKVKSGDVIPKITKVIKELRSKKSEKFNFIESARKAGLEIERREGSSIFWYVKKGYVKKYINK